MQTVLVIDDDAGTRAFVRAALPDWCVLEAEDGSRGLERLLHEGVNPDIIILDVMMEHLDGYDVCALLRANAPQIPILPFTGAREAIPFLNELGCAPVLIKPVSREVFRAAVYHALAESADSIQPGDAVLAIFQQKATERQRAITAQQFTGVLASNPVVRAGLRTCLQSAGVDVTFELASAAILQRFGRGESFACLLAAAEDWEAGWSFAEERGIPFIVIVATLTEGAAVMLLSRCVSLGIVPLNARFVQHIRMAMTTVSAGMRFVAPEVALPFAGSGLRPQEQKVAALLRFDLAIDTIAELLGIAERSVLQYQTRICQHLAVSGARGIREWAKTWERTHPFVAETVPASSREVGGSPLMS